MNFFLKLWHKASSTSARLLRRPAIIMILFMMGLVGYCSYSFATPEFTRNINEEYYFTYQSSGFATSSNYRHINVYKHRAWLFDKEIADLDMIDDSGNDDVEINFKHNRLQLIINKEVKLDTLINEKQCLEMDVDAFQQLEEETEKRRKRNW